MYSHSQGPLSLYTVLSCALQVAEWNELRRRLTPEFFAGLTSFNDTTNAPSRKNAKKAAQLLEGLDTETVKQASEALLALYNWVRAHHPLRTTHWARSTHCAPLVTHSLCTTHCAPLTGHEDCVAAVAHELSRRWRPVRSCSQKPRHCEQP